MKARYYADNEFLDATMGNNLSFMWRSIMRTQDIMKQGGGGKSVMGEIQGYGKSHGYREKKMAFLRVKCNRG